jgi:hypothetical protein
LGELERIARLYGYLPPIDPRLMPVSQGPSIPDDFEVLMSPAPSPPTEPRGIVPPQERANGPQTEAERNWLERLGIRLRQGTDEELARLNPRPVPGDQVGRIRGTGEPRPNPFFDLAQMNAEEMLRRSGQRYPTTQIAPTEETPPTPEEAPAPTQPPPSQAAGRATPTFPTFQGRDPDFERVRRQYEEGRPRQRERDPEERMMRIIAAGLAGIPGRTGLDVASGVLSGIGQGYARESDRDEALWQRDEEARRQFELGLAGLLGAQEQAQFNNALARQTFDRQSAISAEELALRREGLDIQRENAGLNGLLTRMRIAALAQQAGLASDPAQILARGVHELVTRPATQLTVNGRPLTFDVGGQQLTFGQVRDRLLQMQGRASNFASNPLFAANPGMAERAIQAQLGDLFMQRFMTLSPIEQREVLMQLARLGEGRARFGTTRINEDE